MSYYLYILRSNLKETYYTGVAGNPEKRTFFHNHQGKGYTRRWRPWKRVYTKEFNTKQEALAAERVVKGWKSGELV